MALKRPLAAAEADTETDDPCFQPKVFSDFGAYETEHAKSLNQSDAFWSEVAHDSLTWFQDFTSVQAGGFKDGDCQWFLNGKLNASYCCLDQHLAAGKGDRVAILWEGDEPGEERRLTFKELHQGVCRVANAMLAQGVVKGDTVAVYMPMVPELAMVMLACTRIGAVHSVVFAGYSEDALRERLVNAKSKWVFVTDEGKRGGRTLPLKKIVDGACTGAASAVVQKVFVFKRTGIDLKAAGLWHPERDVDADALCAAQRPYCPPAWMDSEDLLFLLFTSGSTGTPKGVAHTTGGYLVYAALTCKESFGLRLDGSDVHACVADCGWITGHSYIVYGPLLNGATTLMFESTPLHPNPGRYWEMVEKYKCTSFYTAPTAIRAVMAQGDEWVTKHDRSSLRVLGTVGEPINPEAWKWYFEVVGEGKCNIVDTYWQTETGGHLMTPMPGKTPMKPGSCCFPHYGIEPVVLDPATGEVLEGNEVEGVLAVARPWPGIMRTCFGDHQRFLATYLQPYPGHFFTGDGCRRDKDGFYWITGRVDDVLNCSGHRLGTAEIESALCVSEHCSEAAVVGFPHDLKGQGICCYVVLAQGAAHGESPQVVKELKAQVRATIGAFATPDVIAVIPGLPKTRSGKIMRRILRKVVAGEEDSLGDVSTLADPTVVEAIIAKVKQIQGR